MDATVNVAFMIGRALIELSLDGIPDPGDLIELTDDQGYPDLGVPGLYTVLSRRWIVEGSTSHVMLDVGRISQA